MTSHNHRCLLGRKASNQTNIEIKKKGLFQNKTISLLKKKKKKKELLQFLFIP